MKKRLTKMICTALTLGFMAVPTVQAAEESVEFSLDKIVVTALRAESKDFDTPASVTVKSGDELRATGATTVIEALQFIEGINIYSQHPYGQSAGRMSSELVIRGAKKGTLVMVNGAPINMNGLFQLDNILLENVEKVEVVRGPGSVMYGSEAFGGVINIVTKKQVANSFMTSAGTNGKQTHSLNLQMGKLAFSGTFADTGECERITESKTAYDNFLGGQKVSLNGAYRFNDKLTLNYTHSSDDMDRDKRLKSNNSLSQILKDTEDVDRFTFIYEGGDVKANLYGTFRNLDYYTKNANGTYEKNTLNTNLKTAKYGLDTNKSWRGNKTEYLAGLTLEREKYKQTKDSTTGQTVSGPFDRNVTSLYTQLTHHPNSKDKLVVGVRGQRAEVENQQTYNQLLPQIQYNHKLNENSTWFVNAGKAFRLPTLTELYAESDRFKSNPNLVPESGWIYETGWKKQINDGTFKATLFAMDIKEHIDTDSTSTFQNFSSMKNEGIELSWEQRLSDKYRYTVGGSYGNPRQLNAAGQWERTYSRIQANMSVNYSCDKWTANLAANYTADRANQAAPAFPVNITLNYKINPETVVFAAVHNALGRHDVTNNNVPSAMSGYYYASPRTVEIGLKHSF